MKARIIFTFIFFFLTACHQERINNNEVLEIIFSVMPKRVETPIGVYTYFDLQHHGRDTCITDKKSIKEFVNLLNQLELENDYYSIDLRCASVLRMKTGRVVSFCFGENNGILYNGCQIMADDEAVFNFIDNNIYGTQPEDYWLNEKMKMILKRMRAEGM